MQLNTEALHNQDAAFAKQLALRDESVLRDIERAYAAPLRQLLRRHVGALLDEHDVDDILAQTLEYMWRGFDSKKGSSVRSFFFHVGKRRLQDRLRRNSRRRSADLYGLKLVDGKTQIEPPADEALIRRATRETHGRIMAIIGEAAAELTNRQRTAFKRRFGAGGGEYWAKQLEAETGTPAKQWRKASDEARSKVRAYLIENGVHYSEEGGHYEVA